MVKSNELERLLYEFSIILESERDLRHLYFISLAVIMIAFNLEKGVIFKFSKRKQCFDPKAGLTRNDIADIINIWKDSSNKGELADYLLKMDITNLYESDLNKKIKSLNMPCDDILKTVLNSLLTKSLKNVKTEDVSNSYIKNILKEMDVKESTYFPLIYKNEYVGFMLVSPKIGNIEEFKVFSVGLSLAMAMFASIKEIDNLKQFINSNKEYIEDRQKLYNIGKTTVSIMHEIKNSLVGVIGLFNKLKDHTDSSEKANTYIKIIDSEIDKLYRFVFDINKYAGNSPLNKEFFDLKEVVDRAIDMTSSINTGFVFSVCIDDSASSIYADKDRLEQVLINLFKNSIEAYSGKNGGKISVTAKRKDGFIVVKIRDNSGGVSEEMLKEIVKPFFTTKSYGTGLGLSIVKEIMREHNGSIEFRNIKNGLECVIKLPMPKNKISGDKDEQKKNYDS